MFKMQNNKIAILLFDLITKKLDDRLIFVIFVVLYSYLKKLYAILYNFFDVKKLFFYLNIPIRN